MKTRTLLLTLEIVVSDLPMEERKECAELGGCAEADLPGVEDVEDYEVADCITGVILNSEEIFSGSNLFVKIDAIKYYGEVSWK